MAFASGPVSFQRFAIDGRFPSDLTDELLAAVRHKAFGRQPPGPDDTQVGWVGPRHVLETDIEPEHIHFGRFVHLAMRVDRLRPPAAVMRAYVHEEEAAMLAAGGREYLHRKERRRAREAARERAEQEARSGAFRRMSMAPVLIDLERRTVYLGGLGVALGDRLAQLFRDTFAAALEPLDVERVARRLLGPTGDEGRLDALRPMRLVPPPDGYTEDEGGADFAAELGWLGKEMLSWLWHQGDVRDAGLRLRSGDEITVMIDRTLRLRCDYGLTGTDVITADGPTLLPEAKAALRIGKQPTRAGLIVGSPLGEFRLSLDALRLGVSGLVVPEDDSQQDARARIEQRFELIADAATLLEAIFELFLRRRISAEWEAEQRAMSAWAQGLRVAVRAGA